MDETAEARVISLDISSAFDLVNHDGLLYKLKSLGVGGPTFNVLITFFLIDNDALMLMVVLAHLTLCLPRLHFLKYLKNIFFARFGMVLLIHLAMIHKKNIRNASIDALGLSSLKILVKRFS